MGKWTYFPTLTVSSRTSDPRRTGEKAGYLVGYRNLRRPGSSQAGQESATCWEATELTERRNLLTVSLDAVYVDTIKEKLVETVEASPSVVKSNSSYVTGSKLFGPISKPAFSWAV